VALVKCTLYAIGRKTERAIIIEVALYAQWRARFEELDSRGTSLANLFSYRLPERQGCVQPYANLRGGYIAPAGHSTSSAYAVFMFLRMLWRLLPFPRL